jgi:hypothetical protein
MDTAFDDDDPWVFSQAIIWFSQLWHLEPSGQNGISYVDDILTLCDGEDKRIWLTCCLNYGNMDDIDDFIDLIKTVDHHESLYCAGICTDEWCSWPATSTEAKLNLRYIRRELNDLGLKAAAHLFFGWGGSQGPMSDGNQWFTDEYDLVFFHNNYPHYDSACVSNLAVLRSMLNRSAYGTGTIGGSQGYFGATGGIYFNGCDPDVSSDYWSAAAFENVIDDHELVSDDTDAQSLFVAMHYVDDQLTERATLFNVMDAYGGWEIGTSTGGGGEPEVIITGTKTDHTVYSFELDDSAPSDREVILIARYVWDGDSYDYIQVNATYKDDGTPASGVAVSADGESKGSTNSQGILTWAVS